MSKINWVKKDIVALIVLSTIVLSILFFCNQNIGQPSEFSELAWSFLHGKTYFINEVNSVDNIYWQGKAYWPLPPFPALIYLPIVFITQKPISQNFLTFIFCFINFGLVFFLVNNRFKFSRSDSWWLSLGYLFASVCVVASLIPLSWYYAHAVATIFIILSLIEYFGKKRYWLIGLCLGAVLLTRFTAALVAIFYLIDLLSAQLVFKLKIKKIFIFTLPIFFCGLLLLGYNYLRFNNPFENGYTLADSYTILPSLHPYGQFSWRYIPSNVFYYFGESFSPNYAPRLANNIPMRLSSPYILPSRFGSLSFFIAAPIFLWLFRADYKNKTNQYLLITAGIIFFVFLSYYYNGMRQIGPRYFNDFLPLLFIILLSQIKTTGLRRSQKITIFFSALLNLYLAVLLFFYMN